jgi:uncharacterized membrane protein
MQPSVLQQSWQGPYPPPDAVERYEKIQPGVFDRIVSMAERMEAAQIEQSAAALKYQHEDSRRGQWLGFSVAAGAVVGAVIIGIVGNPWLAAAFLAVPVMGVAQALVESARKATSGVQRDERANAASISQQNGPPATEAPNSDGRQ